MRRGEPSKTAISAALAILSEKNRFLEMRLALLYWHHIIDFHFKKQKDYVVYFSYFVDPLAILSAMQRKAGNE